MQDESTESKPTKILVAVDFSACSVLALEKAHALAGQKPAHIIILHVVDGDFVQRCISNHLGTEEHIKETLFLHARNKINNLLSKEKMQGEGVEKVICEGTPYIEINKKAVQHDVDMVVMGSQGNSGDMNTIFFGSTAEKVLRFIKRPVLCVPPEEDHKL